MLRGKVSDEGQLEHLKSVMRQTSEVRRRKTENEHYFDGEVDYNFYIYQFILCIYHKETFQITNNVSHHNDENLQNKTIGSFRLNELEI